jgi:hypothetical protein
VAFSAGGDGDRRSPEGATVLPNGSYYLPVTDEIIPADTQHHHQMSGSIIVPIIQ